MTTLTAFVLRRRRLIGLFWLILLLAGGYASATITKHLSQSFQIPGTASAKANGAIIGTYRSGGSETPLVPVIRLPAGASVSQPGVTAGLRAGFAAAADPVIPLAAVQRALLARLPRGSTVAVTGITPLTNTGGSGKGAGVLEEVLIGGFGALAVLVFVFASFLAFAPLLIAAVSITTSFLVILGLTYLTSINFVTQFLVSLIGLGVAIDYSLLVITRWREEVAHGRDNQAAIGVAMTTAGRAVVFSGVTFRSLLLPAKAIVLNLLSVGAVYGVLVLVWQQGHGSNLIWGLPATGAITAWIPLFVFAFLYGLSMDYEVFLITRMREEYDGTGSTDAAVITGIGRTGRLVTSAALILFLAMAALASAPFTFLKIFATGVGAGILLDATVVRSLLVPALVSLFGKWNWWLPTWAARLLRVEASPVAALRDVPAPKVPAR